MNIKTYLLSAVALAAVCACSPALAADPVRLCTGGEGGIYNSAGKEIAKMAGRSIAIDVFASEGTLDNMTRMVDVATTDPEACDLMVGQPDGPAYWKATSPGKAKKLQQIGPPLHREYLHVICGIESGVDDLSDLEDDTSLKLAVGAPGSGAWLLWENIKANDDDYADVPTESIGGSDALSAVVSGDVACMLDPSALGGVNVTNANANYGDAVKLVSATDGDFDDATDLKGKPLYTFETIPSSAYDKLQTGMFASRETISWNAAVFINTERLAGEARTNVIKAIERAAGGIRSNYGK